MVARNLLAALLLLSSGLFAQSFTISNLSLAKGTITGNAAQSGPNYYTNPLSASGTATLTPGGQATVTLSGVATNNTICNANSLIQLALTFSFNSTDSLTVQFTASPSNASGTTIPLTGTFNVTGGAGIYNGKGGSGTIAVSMTLSVDASGNPTGFTATGSGSGTLTAQLAPPPSIVPQGVVPVFSYVPIVQPGSWISIYGANFSTAITSWNGNFPTSLDNVSVSIDGKPAYLWFVSPGQINAQVPDDTNYGACVPITVTTPGGTADAVVTLAHQQPSFLLQADGKHVLGVIPVPDGSGAYGSGQNSYDLMGPVSATTRPVKRGESLILYGVGFGPTTTVEPSGQAFSGATPLTKSPGVVLNGQVLPAVTGIFATLEFTGLVSAGEYQMNIQIPNATPVGDVSIVAGFSDYDHINNINFDNVETQTNLFIAVQ